MMNIRIDERHAYVELEIFGRYDLERMNEVLDAMRALSDRHGHFSQLEVHHGKPDNMWAAFSKFSSLGSNTEEYAFLSKMRRYAIVTDNPGLLLRLMARFGRGGKRMLRIFPLHERDHARQWIEEAAAMAETSNPS